MFRWLMMLALCLPAPAADDLEALSDEFGSAETLSGWTDLHRSLGLAAPYSKLDVGTTREGRLSIVPRPGAWYRDGMGPLLYKSITGDFIATVYATARSRRQPDQAPAAAFNAAGLIARDPASQQGRQNWVVINVGRQQSFLGTEVKTTVNSNSQLFLEEGPAEGEVRMVRLGADFHLLRRLRGEDSWRRLRVFRRPDLPATLQVGLMCNGWTNNPDLLADYDWVRFARPAGADDVTRALEPRP